MNLTHLVMFSFFDGASEVGGVSFQPAWARYSTLMVGPAGMGATNNA